MDVPRQTRKVPWRLTRFNYWNVAGIRPQDADETVTLSPAWVRSHSHELCRRQFLAHLNGRSCGVVGCRMDRRLGKLDRDHRTSLALSYYIRSDRLWAQDRAAHRALRALPQTLRRDVERLDREIEGHRSRTGPELLKEIARDQLIFETITGERLSGQLDKVGERFKLGEAAVRGIYRNYSRQLHLLLGDIRGRARELLAQRGLPTSLSDPVIPRKRVVATRVSRREMVPRLLIDREERVVSMEQVKVVSTDEELIEGDNLPETERLEMALHWFAHAWRNLRRYLDGNPPRPWASNCASACRAERVRFLSQLRPPRPSS